ncbi:hypothetical protein FACS1894132_00290 [Clostridia bacterium]|nr:hypothetical protein FACS1894132_00290 [Clostridia bacterium]
MLIIKREKMKIYNNKIIKFFVLLVLSYITARAEVNGLLSPFNVAVCAALPSFYSTAVLLGTLFSYLFGGLVGQAIVYIIAIIMVAVIGFVTSHKTANVSMGLVLVSMFTGVIAVGIYVHSKSGAFITGALISILTAAAAYFIRDLFLYWQKHNLLTLKGKSAHSLAFCYLLLIVTLSSFSPAFINIGLIVSAFLILEAINRYSSQGGLVCSALTSCGIFIYDVQIGYFTVFLPLIGYGLGCLPKMRKVLLAMVFMICNMAVLLLTGVDAVGIKCLIALTMGSSGYIWLNFEKQIFDTALTPLEENIRDTTVQRLRFIANSMLKVKKNAQSAAMHLQKGKSFSKMNELQSVLYGQLEVSAELIGDIEHKISENVSYDLDIIKLVSGVLSRKGVKFDSLTAYYNQSNRLFIEAYTNYEYDMSELSKTLSDALNIQLGYLENVKTDDTYRLIFTSISDYGLDYHTYQKAGGKDVCGDNYDIFYNGSGTAFVALSDGMGTGKRAAIESKMLLNHFKRLMKAGIEDVPLSVRMINYIMNVKSDDDMFATLDLAKINLDTGETKLYKYGAGATLLKHDDDVTVISDTSMPVGIMDKIEPYSEHKISLEIGDLLILLSDGVPESEYPSIKKLLLKEHTDLDLLAKKIGRQASDSSRDDITVIIAKIT